MVDSLSKEKRSWNMSRIKGKDTKPELILRSLLHKAGFRFRLHDKKLPGKPDIVLKRYKTIIFVNGCFWHRHNNCKHTYSPKSRKEFWEKKFRETVKRDEKKEALLRDLGWNILVVWECDIKKRPEDTLLSVVQNLRQQIAIVSQCPKPLKCAPLSPSPA